MSTDDTGDDGASVSRRDFVKAAGSIGAIAGFSSVTVDTDLDGLWTDDEHHYVGDEYGEYGASDVIHTTCGQCNTFCPVKVRLADTSGTGEYSSLVRKLAGNPYSFLTTQPFGQVPYDSDPEDVAMGDLEGTGEVDTDRWSLSGGRICLKGQAGIQTAFDSYRVRKPMKRVGPGVGRVGRPSRGTGPSRRSSTATTTASATRPPGDVGSRSTRRGHERLGGRPRGRNGEIGLRFEVGRRPHRHRPPGSRPEGQPDCRCRRLPAELHPHAALETGAGLDQQLPPRRDLRVFERDGQRPVLRRPKETPVP